MPDAPTDLTTPQLDETCFAAIDRDRLLSPAISTHPPRILILYGSLRARSFSRLSAEEAGRILTALGAEVRFFMPVLNVPFRLIFAWNPQRDGVLNNQLQPTKAFVFRFAVGSTF